MVSGKAGNKHADRSAEAERERRAVETWGIGIYEHDHVTDEICGSARLRELYGIGLDEQLSIEVFGAATFPADMPLLLAAISKAHQPNGDGKFDVLHRIRHRDGAVRWIHTRAKTSFQTVDGQRVPLLTTGSIVDMTHTHELKLALQRQEERLSLATAASNVGIFEVEHSPSQVASSVYWSPTLCKMLGHADEKSVSMAWFLDRLHPDDADTSRPLMERSLAGDDHERHELECRWLHPNGQVLWLLLRITTLFDNSGPSVRPVRTVGALLDISKDKHLAEQYRQAKKMEAIGSLAGGVAHDFNNLLSVIFGFADLGAAQLASDHPTQAHLQEILRAAERATALTRQLLAFSRKQMLQPQVIDINEIITNLTPMFQRLIDESIEFSMLSGKVPLHFKADPNQVEQILINLVVNARDAMPNGGVINIETRQVMVDEEHTASRVELKPGPYVVIAVSDTGHGMDAATQARIFDPFFTTKDQGQGTGLGLATVFGIVKQSGGDIWVYSEPGRGTSFKVYFPSTDEPVMPAPPHKVVRTEHQDGTILVAEDDEQLRKMVTTVLKGAGYRVLEAANPVEALGVARGYQQDIHLILTDVIMPQMTGRQLAEELKQSRTGTAVLYMSGYTEDSIVHHGVLDSAINFLAKPFTASVLLEKVCQVLASTPRGSIRSEPL